MKINFIKKYFEGKEEEERGENLLLVIIKVL